MPIFRHMLMIKLTRDVTGDQKDALVAGLSKLPDIIDVIRRYEFGFDLGLGDENYDFALVADFDSKKDWELYTAHPDHQLVVHNVVRPIADQLIRTQYEVG
ncbi:MAG: Dabb family protein [Acidimicrobiia bacterium]